MFYHFQHTLKKMAMIIAIQTLNFNLLVLEEYLERVSAALITNTAVVNAI